MHTSHSTQNSTFTPEFEANEAPGTLCEAYFVARSPTVADPQKVFSSAPTREIRVNTASFTIQVLHTDETDLSPCTIQGTYSRWATAWARSARASTPLTADTKGLEKT
jgi:hypothetical protein